MKYILDILIVMLIIIAAMTYYLVTFFFIDRYFVLGLLFFIPAILLIKLRKRCIKEKFENKKIIGKTTSLLIISGFVAMCFLIYIYIIDHYAEITNSRYYSRILNMTIASNRDLLKHFPKEIPENARDVLFYYTTRWNRW